ncbi:hypothetical protein ACFQX7_11395 [Luedemannella flava]
MPPLHLAAPCSCDETSLPVRHTLRTSGDDLLAVYQGECPRCGLPRQFAFVLDPATPPPPPAFGGAAPSRIVCPGQFAIAADNAARATPLSPAGLTPTQREYGHDALAYAVAAQEEVLKFVPEGADAVPESAFTSPEGARLYAGDPGRFRRARLVAVADAYRSALAQYS